MQQGSSGQGSGWKGGLCLVALMGLVGEAHSQLPLASSLYNLRQQVSPNNSGVPSGDQIQAGAYCVVPFGSPCNVLRSLPITGSASQNGTTASMLDPLDAVNPNHLRLTTPYQPSLTGSWLLTFVDSSGSASFTTPTLPAPPVVASALSVGYSAGSSPTTPVITWTEPQSFLTQASNSSGGAGVRIQIFDTTTLVGSVAPQIYAAAVNTFNTSTGSYSWAIPASFVTNGTTYSLQTGRTYDIEVQNLLFRTLGAGTGNPNV